MLCVSSDGHLEIVSGEDDVSYLRTELKAGDEISELFEFIEETQVEQIRRDERKTVEKSLSSLVEEVFLLIPGATPPEVMPLRGGDFTARHPEIAKMIDGWLCSDWESIRDYDFDQWISDHGFRHAIGSLERLQWGDILINGQGGQTYSGLLIADAESAVGVTPTIVLRPAKSASKMWLFDYLEHSEEATGLIERICKGWKHLPKGLSRITLNTPRTKCQQVADTIERRAARAAYLKYLRAAMCVREPFSRIKDQYEKRILVARDLHTEFLDDLVSQKDPLPFFIEYPYRVFRRESDTLRKVKASWRLLSILAKIPLFLVVEELLHQGHEIGTEFLMKLEEKPASDGLLTSLHSALSKRLQALPENPLMIFPEMSGILSNHAGLEPIVTRRNRLNHEPFDHEGFIEIMDEEAPQIVSSLRRALANCEFLVPQNLRFEKGAKILRAESVCSPDALFESIELKTALSLEDFPTEQLVAYRRDRDLSLPMGRLLSTKPILQESRDFGVFDRVEKDASRTFVYLRSALESEDPFGGPPIA